MGWIGWLRGTSFRINCTSPPCFASSFMRLWKRSPNAPKHYAMHHNMSLRSNGVDWVCSVQKIPMWLRGTNFCIYCTSSPCFASSFMQLRNDPKCNQTLWNAPKHEFRVQWGWIRCVGCEKLKRDFVAQTFALIAPVDPVLHRVPCSYETIPNAPKHYGLSASVAKNYNVTSWHEPLH